MGLPVPPRSGPEPKLRSKRQQTGKLISFVVKKREADHVATRTEGHILFTVHGVSHGSGIQLLASVKVPQNLARPRIHRRELTFEISRKDETARGESQALTPWARSLPGRFRRGHDRSFGVVGCAQRCAHPDCSSPVGEFERGSGK